MGLPFWGAKDTQAAADGQLAPPGEWPQDGRMTTSPTGARAAATLLVQSLGEAGLESFRRRLEGPPSPSLDEEIRNCEQCSLCESRTQAVPGEGPIPADFMFIGEAPGADEDASGRPFIGKAGKLLTRIIEDGMKIPRREVYIANILKCRPPGNRDPLPEETRACAPWLTAQIQKVQPKVILALGRHAACHLLGKDSSLSSLRGRSHTDIPGLPPVVPTYHPAYLLRNPGAKKDCWEDIQLAMKVRDTKLDDS